MKSPSEVLTAELRGCVNGYVGAPALATQCVSALRAAGYMIVPARSDNLRPEDCRMEMRMRHR